MAGERRRRWLVRGMLVFLVSLGVISVVVGTGEAEVEADLVTSSYSQVAWELFLTRRNTPVPSFIPSLSAYNSTSPPALQPFPVLLQHPSLPYDQVSCLPRVFGYSQEQADSLFSPIRSYPPCGNPQTSSLRLDRK